MQDRGHEGQHGSETFDLQEEGARYAETTRLETTAGSHSHKVNVEARKPPIMAEIGLSFFSVGSASMPKVSKAVVPKRKKAVAALTKKCVRNTAV